MKTKHLFIVAVAIIFTLGSCKKQEAKKEVEKEIVAANYQTASISISGMTCEIGCAKTIQSKLSKKEGVSKAKVVFTDSIAKVTYDANTTSVPELVSFIDGIAGGNMYKATELKP